MKVARVNSNLLDRLPNTYGSLIDKFFNEELTTKRNLTSFRPQVDALETEKEFRLNIALPGFGKEDINLNLEDGKLTVSGERKFVAEEKTKYHFIETNYGSFKRSFFLPDNILETGITAQFENGILGIVVPKDEVKVLKRQIEIK